MRLIVLLHAVIYTASSKQVFNITIVTYVLACLEQFIDQIQHSVIGARTIHFIQCDSLSGHMILVSINQVISFSVWLEERNEVYYLSWFCGLCVQLHSCPITSSSSCCKGLQGLKMPLKHETVAQHTPPRHRSEITLLLSLWGQGKLLAKGPERISVMSVSARRNLSLCLRPLDFLRAATTVLFL